MVFIQLNQRREKRPLPDGDRKASTPSKQRRPVRKGRIGPGARDEKRFIKEITEDYRCDSKSGNHPKELRRGDPRSHSELAAQTRREIRG